jgi:hypothetical protein
VISVSNHCAAWVRNGRGFLSEETLVAALELALQRDTRLASGEDYITVTQNSRQRGAETVDAEDHIRDCETCVTKGFGWSLKKAKCGMVRSLDTCAFRASRTNWQKD